MSTTPSRLVVGLTSSILLILLSKNGPWGWEAVVPGVAKPVKMGFFPLENPGIVSIPLGFLGAYLGTIFSKRDPNAEAKFAELSVRAETGLGAEKSSSGH